MTNETRQTIGALISARQDCAFRRLQHNAEYVNLVSSQDRSEQLVEEYYQRFDKADRVFIRRHYEGEKFKESLELDEIYLQGLRDSFRLCAFFLGLQKL